MFRYKGGNENLDKVFTINKVYDSVNSKGKLVQLNSDLKNVSVWVMCDCWFDKVGGVHE